MTDLTGYRSKIRIVLGDTGSDRYDDAVLDGAVRWALAAYSKALPQVKTCSINVTAEGREQSLTALTDLLTVLEVNFPYQAGCQTPAVLQQWYFYRRDGHGLLYISGRRSPMAGDVIRLTYTAWHTIAGLGDATVTTIPTAHETLFENGAAGKAAMMRGIHLVEAYGRKSEEPEKLKTWSEGLLADFLDDLLSLKSWQVLRGTLTNGWTLDRWDRRQKQG